MYDESWTHLANCSWETPGLRIPGVVHSGDVISAPYPDGGRETCNIDIPELMSGFPRARFVVLAVHSFSYHDWATLDNATVFVANPQARGTGPGGMAIIGAARLTGEATKTIGGYLDLGPCTLSREHSVTGWGSVSSTVSKPWEPDTTARTVAGSRDLSAEGVVTGNSHGPPMHFQVHFVFVDQPIISSRASHTANSSFREVGQMLSNIEKSRNSSNAQTLADASALQAALVCNRVIILSGNAKPADDVARGAETSTGGIIGSHVISNEPPLELVRGKDEGRFPFYQRLVAALDRTTPATPAAGKEVSNYQWGTFHGGVIGGKPEEDDASGRNQAMHTVFFGGELDDWLEIIRELDASRIKRGAVSPSLKGTTITPKKPAIILVNVRSAEKVLIKDEGDVMRVNGATSYGELVEAVALAREMSGDITDVQ